MAHLKLFMVGSSYSGNGNKSQSQNVMCSDKSQVMESSWLPLVDESGYK